MKRPSRNAPSIDYPFEMIRSSLDSRIFQSAFCVISRHILLDEMEGNLFYEHVQGAWTFSLSILYHHISLSCQLIIRRADFNEHVYVLFVIIILFFYFFIFSRF